MRARMTQIQENIRDSESEAFGLAKSNNFFVKLDKVINSEFLFHHFISEISVWAERALK